MSLKVLPSPWHELPWRAWHELQHDRQWIVDGIGAGIGAIRIISRPSPISWMAVDRWCDSNGVTAEERPDIHALVRAMDLVFLQFRNDEITEDLQNSLRN
ncbi:hypothetical protein JRX38_00960 [Gluconobacter cerinus]|uniref:hypothetical protein n=1 Tax=Gluconobacter cerinus TaxID=38307 RepID=UPI00193FC656|nr:hypothetical protein [Gluconobacter cerinus]MBM3096604.1 hypothetical protein [Gluconobacter cerinus]